MPQYTLEPPDAPQQAKPKFTVVPPASPGPSIFDSLTKIPRAMLKGARDESAAAGKQLQSDFAPGSSYVGIGPGIDETVHAGKTILDALGYGLSGIAGAGRGLGESLVPDKYPEAKKALGEAVSQVAPLVLGVEGAKAPRGRYIVEGPAKEPPAAPAPQEPPGGKGPPPAAPTPQPVPAEAPKPSTDLVPAIRKPTGEVVHGEKGKTHADIAGITDADHRGFVGADGVFQSRKEAGQSARAQGADVPKSLTSEDLNAAEKGGLPAVRGDGGKGGPPAPPGDASFRWPDRDDEFEGERPKDVDEKDVFKMARNVDDLLYRVQTNNDADKIEAREFLQDPAAGEAEAKPHWTSPDFQERAYKEVEENLKDPHARIGMTDDVKEFLGSKFGRWYAEQSALYKWIKDHPTGKALLAEDSLPDISQGYVHRIPKGKGSMYDKADPEGYQRDPLFRGRSLSKGASGLKGRKFFVLEGPDGTRAFAPRNFVLKDEPYHGKTYTHNGKTYTAKYATTDEIENATATGKYGFDRPVTYHKNLMVNTLENVLRLRRVKRAMVVTDALKTILTDRGLLYYGDKIAKAPDNFITSRLPQFMGARMHPAFAYALDDFYGSLGDDIDDVEVIEKLNALVTRSIFFTPFPHLENVASFWAITRGADWVRPAGWKSLMRNLSRATMDTMAQGPITKAMLREGSALQYPRIANQNFHKLMIERMGKEIMDDPQTWAGVARKYGYGGKAKGKTVGGFLRDTGTGHDSELVQDLVKAVYRTSQKYMWLGNDILMQQRVLELMDQGAPLNVAIKRAEHDIPNYRIPSQVWRGGAGRAVSRFLQSPNYIMFGRYKYDQVKFITQLANDLIYGRDAEMKALMEPQRAIEKDEAGRPQLTTTRLSKEEAARQATGTTRKEALAKAIIMVGMGTMGFALGDRALRAVTGNKDARMRRPGAWAISDDIEQWASGAKDWASALGSLISLAPATDVVSEGLSNRDQFGREIFKSGTSPEGKVMEGTEWLAGKFAPVGELMNMMKPGGAAQVAGRNLPIGVSLPPPGSKARARKAQRGEEKRNRKSERRDPIENELNALLKGAGL